MKTLRHIFAALILALGCCVAVSGATPFIMEPGRPVVHWDAGVFGNAGSGDFAPYYIASNHHGVVTQANGAYARVAARKDLALNSRFSYGFGADLIAGAASSVDYDRFSSGRWDVRSEHPAHAWIQQLYGQLKYRAVFLTVGLKEQSSALLSHTLSSGDLVESGNARPIPQVRAGFIDFQDIPYTHGWVQIQGEISYGKMMDNAWMRHHYNYYDYHINLGALYTYKRCFFRTKPSMPLSVTVGMQLGAFFGGTSTYYRRGELIRTDYFSRTPSQFLKMLLPTNDGADYYAGSTLGCWDLQFRYRLPSGSYIKAYLQKPFEDGSGIGFLNGFDGIWGVEYDSNNGGIVSGAVIEYLDFTNQSGPLHWDAEDHPGTDLRGEATGADDYYNNAFYNSYANYGMNIGSPVLRSPIYNVSGYPGVLYNLTRGFHAGVEGRVVSDVAYRLLGGYRRSWGTPFQGLSESVHTTSMSLEGIYTPRSVSGLKIAAQIAFDHGRLYGNNVGALVSVSYSGDLHF